MNKLWDTISNIGIGPGIMPNEQGRVRFINRIVIISAVLTFFYFIIDLTIKFPERGFDRGMLFYVFHISFMLLFAPVLLLNHLGQTKWAVVIVLLGTSGLIFINSYVQAKPYTTELYILALVGFAFVVVRDMRIIIIFFLIQLAFFLLLLKNIYNNQPDLGTYDMVLALRSIIAFSMIFAISYLMRKEAKRYQDVIEEKNNQLAAEHNELVKLNFTKDKIFSIISHDLRSPIASLSSVLSMLKDDHLSQEEFRKILKGLGKQTEQVGLSLNELLTWSKAQLHGINPEPQIVKLKPLIYEVVAVNKIVARNKGIVITTYVPNENEVWCDMNMLKSVLTNLVTNAIKFTPVGGAISVFCKDDGQTVSINVEDTGVGILPENMAKILSPSIHFTTRGTNNEKGTGLGLVMCQEFIAKNKGTFHIKSEDGKGTLFTLQFKKMQAGIHEQEAPGS